MLNFNLSAIPGLPVNANITEVSLGLYYTEGDTGSTGDLCSLFVMARSWNCQEITWNHAANNDPWKQLDLDTRFYSNQVGDTVDFPGGGDRLFPCAATAPCATAAHRWEEYIITDAMIKYIKNPETFHGLLLKPYLGNASRWYASSEYGEVDKRPKLTIKYSGTGINKQRNEKFLALCQIRANSNNIQLFVPLQITYAVTMTNLKGRILHVIQGSEEKWHTIQNKYFNQGIYLFHIKARNINLVKKFSIVK